MNIQQIGAVVGYPGMLYLPVINNSSALRLLTVCGAAA